MKFGVLKERFVKFITEGLSCEFCFSVKRSLLFLEDFVNPGMEEDINNVIPLIHISAEHVL